MSRTRLCIGLAVTAAGLLVGGLCGGGCILGGTMTQLTMRNNSTEVVHMWAGEEGDFTPGNIPLGQGSAVQPGAARSYTKNWPREDVDQIPAPPKERTWTVYVGRDGQLLAQQTFTFNIYRVNKPEATWNGTTLEISEP